MRGYYVWHRGTCGRRTQTHYLLGDFERRPLHGFAVSQCFWLPTLDADPPEVAAIDVERISVMLIGGEDDGSLIGTERYIFGFKFGLRFRGSQQRGRTAGGCDLIEVVPSVLFGGENDAVLCGKFKRSIFG